MTALNSFRVAVGLVFVAMAGPSLAAAPSGTVLAVVQSANIDGETGKKVLEPEAPVFAGDRVDTGPVGEAQIRFRDNTKLVVGPNSSMVIDAFVFNDDDTVRQISINAVKGAFRFITGTSRKDAYTITTPTATIGVRGTEFDVAVEREGTTRVANFEGMTRICRRQTNGVVLNPQQDCVEVDEPCSLSVVRPAEPGVVRLNNDDIEFRNRQLKYYFPYVRSQARLLADFQVNTAQCKFSEAIISPSAPPPVGPGPGPDVPPPPVIVPDPVLPLPPPPSISPGGRDHNRPVFDHGAVFR